MKGLIVLPIIVPIAASILIVLFRKGWGLALASAFSMLGLSIYFLVTKFQSYYWVGAWETIGIALNLDPLAKFMLLTIFTLGSFSLLFAKNYMQKFTQPWKFYALFSMLLGSMSGVVITGDLFNLFVFMEITVIAAYSLVAFGVEAEELEAAYKYAVMGTVSSLLILLGIGFVYSSVSSLNFVQIAEKIKNLDSMLPIALAWTLFITGFGMKAALVPFHAWLPDAHPSAPAPMSAILSGVVVKCVGVYPLIRFSVVFRDFHHGLILKIFMALGAISLLIGVLLAVWQWDLKRLLAYHTVSQIGYIFLGIGTGNIFGILGGLAHIFFHSLFKGLLFLGAGSVYYISGTRDLKSMGFSRKALPVTYGSMAVASFSISGIPPFNGFWSKLLIILGTIKAGYLGYALIAAVGSLLTLASFTKVLRYAFGGDRKTDVREVPALMSISMGFLALLCVVSSFILVPPVYDIFLEGAVEVLKLGGF